MAGDLTKWSAPDVPRTEGDHVQFKRKGGWFVTKKLLILVTILIILLLIVAIFITKKLTERQYKTESEQSSTESEYSSIIRLSEHILPQHFELKLKPYLDVSPAGIKPFTLFGQVLIHFIVTKPTPTITLNYAGKNVNYTSAFSSNNKPMTLKSDKYIRNLELYSVEFEEILLPANNYSLQLMFNSLIDDEQKGFYRRSYKTALNENERWMGVSDLEPAHARKLFPCFDEPKFRSTFDISIHRLKNMSALANTKKRISVPDYENNAWMWDTFDKTPPIPSHKIAVLICDMSVSKVDVNNTTLSLWTRTDLFNKSLNLIDVTTSLLKFYHSYFTVLNPISKLDLVAVPNYMNDKSGSWGLITFSESLIFDNKGDKEEEVKFALEISKKLAEQWFGNLVSFDWWADMWIKDSVSSYLAYLALDEVRPDYEIMSSFVVDLLQRALDAESYPLSEEIYILSDITDVWMNDNSPLKGASLLHMIASISSYEYVQESINKYLEKWSEKVTTSLQFWESFGRTLEKHQIDMTQFIDNWLKHGYPVVNCNYNEEKGEVVIGQTPFYLQYPPSHSSTWDIPITYSTSERILSSEALNQIWLKHDEPVLKFILPTNDSWIMANIPQKDVSGFYRVNYDLNNWKSLTKEMASASNLLQEELQASLLDDSYQLAKAGRLPYFIPLNFTTQVLKEATLRSFRTIDVHLKFLKLFFHGKNNHEALFKDFVQKLFVPLLSNLGTSSNLNDSFTGNYIRALALKWSCQYDISECINWANSSFKSWINNEAIIMESSVSDVVINTGIRYGTKQDSEIVLNKSLSNSILPKLRLKLLRCLASSASSSFTWQLLEMTLQLNKSKGNVKFSNEDVVVIWETLTENLDAKEHALKFFMDYWPDIYKQYHTNYRVLSAIIKGATNSLTEERHLSDVASVSERIKKETQVPLRLLNSALNRLIVKTAWRNTKFNTVKNLLQKMTTPFL